MINYLKSGLVTAALSSLLAGQPAVAAQSVETVAVALAGEAGEPMKIDIDKAVVKAGTIEFKVSNVAVGTDHEMVLVKLANKDQKIAADPKTHRIDEKKLKSLGEVAGLKAGDTGVLKVKLAAGEYALICNHKSHYELGMATRVSVTN